MIKIKKCNGFKDFRGNLFWASPKIIKFNYKYLTFGTLNPNTFRGGHYHKHTKEKLMCISGEFVFFLNNEWKIVKEGEIVDIPKNKTHTIYNHTNVISTFIEFKSEEFDKNDTDTYKNN